MSPVLPGATIGFLGGGQLARMSAMAARAMGYGVAVLDPDPDCAAGPLADLVIAAPLDDAAAAARLAARSAVVTFDIERVAPAAARAAAVHAPVRPSPEVLELIQDRARQKLWLQEAGFPVGPWLPVADAPSARAAVVALGPCRLKRRRDGYDGRGQAPAPTQALAVEAHAALGGAPCVAEAELALEAELSVLVARSADGAVAVHPAARNWHEDGVLVRSVLPAPLPERVLAEARQLALGVADALKLEGVLAVELFLDRRHGLLVNELAPRPHNTFHAAGAACAVGQFEQHVRAICGLPLGDPAPHATAALLNLLGEDAAVAHEALAVPGVTLHLYGKAPRPRRKVGHLCASAPTAEEALERIARARAIIEAARSPAAVATGA
ncbi:MAG: 5-(carboxyamino)imidazole ribonucleotide synthase [Anaeromyxobacter sp.]